MSFFYDLNKKLDSIRATPEVTHQQLNERNMSQHAKGIEKYTKPGMEKLSKLGREGASKAKMAATRKEFNQYDNDQVDESDFGPGRAGPNKNLPGPEYSFSPDTKNYKTPHSDASVATSQNIDKTMGQGYSAKNYPNADVGAAAMDGRGQTKYINRTAPGVINKIKDKLGYDMPDPAYGPRPDERERLAKRYPKPANENLIPVPAKPKSMVDKQVSKMNTPPPTRPTRPNPAPKGDAMGTIKGGVWTADPPKPGEKGVPLPKNHERVPEAGAPMTAKQKSFAKLAPPANKITFADKIAGAKKEVDEMLGDVAAEAMRSALGGGKGRNAGMEESAGGFTQADWDKVARKKRHLMMLNPNLEPEDAEQIAAEKLGYDYEEVLAWIEGDQNMEEAVKERSKGTAFDMSAPRDAKPKVGSVERGAKHDIKHTDTGRIVTRRTDDQGHSVGADDDADADAAPRGRGRPKGTKGAIGAKGPSGKSKLMTKEGEDDPAEKGEYDREGDMALDDIDTIESAANELQSIIDADDNLPEWVQSKINKAMDYLDTARDYMAAQGNDQEPIAEKAVSKQQQKFMGMAHAMQKGEKVKGASKELKKVAKTMKPKDTEDFAKTKHKGLPDKVNKKEVDENSEDGRLTTTQTGAGKTSTSSSTGRISATVDKGTVSVKPAKSGGMSFGKGIYDSMNRELENMIAESMSINMSDSTEGNKSLTVTATDDDAMKLAMILKSAGLGGGDMHGGDMHGHMVDENAPDYPTNTQTSNDALQYAGGLNKPKADIAGNGQSTVPVVATRPQNEEDALRRMMEMAGLAEAAKPDFLDLDKDNNKDEPMKDAAADDVNEEDTVEESIQRMREMAGIREAKKTVDEEKTEEGNLFTKGLEDDDVKIGDKIPGTNAIKKKDIDESIFALTNQWQAYKG